VQSHSLYLLQSTLVESLLVSRALLDLEKDRLECCDPGVCVFDVEACFGQSLILANADVIALN